MFNFLVHHAGLMRSRILQQGKHVFRGSVSRDFASGADDVQIAGIPMALRHRVYNVLDGSVAQHFDGGDITQNHRTRHLRVRFCERHLGIEIDDVVPQFPPSLLNPPRAAAHAMRSSPQSPWPSCLPPVFCAPA